MSHLDQALKEIAKLKKTGVVRDDSDDVAGSFGTMRNFGPLYPARRHRRSPGNPSKDRVGPDVVDEMESKQRGNRGRNHGRT